MSISQHSNCLSASRKGQDHFPTKIIGVAFTMRNQSCRNFAVLLQLPTWKWIILCDENQIWHLNNFWFFDDFLCKTLIFLSSKWMESVYFVSRYCCKVSVCQILPRLICKWNYETQLSKAKHKTKILSDITGLLWSTK